MIKWSFFYHFPILSLGIVDFIIPPPIIVCQNNKFILLLELHWSSSSSRQAQIMDSLCTETYRIGQVQFCQTFFIIGLIDHFLLSKLISKLSFNPKRAGIFWRSKSRGGVESTRSSFRAPVLSNSMQIVHKWSQMKADIFTYM